MNQDELSTIKNYISVIEKERNAFIFLEPVDYVGMNLPDYPQIIKHPMDLGTIKKKINDNKYTSTEEIYKDIQLVWDNCKRYNMEGSDVYKMAQYCEKFTKKYFDKHNSQNIANASAKKKKPVSNNGSNVSGEGQENTETKENNLNLQIPLNEEEDNKKEENIEVKEEEEDKNDNGNGLSGYEKVTISIRVKKRHL